LTFFEAREAGAREGALPNHGPGLCPGNEMRALCCGREGGRYNALESIYDARPLQESDIRN
jgi:hypothetical protein